MKQSLRSEEGKSMHTFQFRGHRALAVALLASVLLWDTSPLLALDLFGSGKSEEQAQAPAGRASSLPSLSDTAKHASPAVVNISTTQKVERRRRMPPFGPMPGPGPNPFGGEDPFEEFFRRFFGDRPPPGQQRSLGSGFIVSEDGYIITNNHVVGDADKITVRLSDKEEYEAKVVGSDEKTDIAVVKINPKTPLHAVPLGSSADLQVGDWVMAIGNPFGLDQSVTAGIVSAKGRVIGAGPYDVFIQTDASINPGNSGGPLLNLKGEVVGINTAIVPNGQGIGFAIPINTAKPLIPQLVSTGKVTRGYLGLNLQTLTPALTQTLKLPDRKGALVSEVTPGSPAAKAGLQRGDVIVTFDGKQVESAHDLATLVAATPVGKNVSVMILRDGNKQTVPLTVGRMPSDEVQS